MSFWSTILNAVMSVFGPTEASLAAAPPAASTGGVAAGSSAVTYGGLTALVSMVEAFPLVEAKALLTGQGSVPDALDLTEKAIALLATVDPAGTPEAAVIEAGLEAAAVLLSLRCQDGEVKYGRLSVDNHFARALRRQPPEVNLRRGCR